MRYEHLSAGTWPGETVVHAPEELRPLDEGVRRWDAGALAVFLVACGASPTTPTPRLPPGQGPPVGAPTGVAVPTPPASPTIRAYTATRTAAASNLRAAACDRLARRNER